MIGKILILEDDDAIRSMLAINLKRDGFIVYETSSGEKALDIVDEVKDIDISILDIMLGGSIDGIEVCKRIRKRYSFMGIIMLTARAQERDKVIALEGGADDYVTKPFSVTELMARLSSLLRRVRINTENSDTNTIRLGKFEIDDLSRKFYKDRNEIELTPTEYSIVRLFMKNPNKAINRDEILTKVWGEDYFGEIKIVDVNMRRLRKKIEEDPSNPQYIETVWGIGYRWEER